MKSLTAPAASADARETARIDQAELVAGSPTRRPAQPLSAARQASGGLHQVPERPRPDGRLCGGYMMGSGIGGGFMLGSGK